MKIFISIKDKLSIGLLLDFLGLRLLQLGDLSLTLVRNNTTTPVFPDLIEAIVVVCLHRFSDLGEGTTIFRVDVCQTDRGTGLAATHCAKTCLTLHDAIGHSHTSAQGRKVQYELNGINIVSNANQLGLLGFNERSDRVGSLAKGRLSLSWLISLALGLLNRAGSQTVLAGLLGLRSVLVQKLEELGGGLLINGLSELVDRRWYLDSGVKNGPLPLDTDVLRPANEAAQVTTWLDILADGKVLGSLLKERIVLPLCGSLLRG